DYLRLRLTGVKPTDPTHLDVYKRQYGIPADKLPHVFGMFAQLRSRVSTADSGLGIGLALVKYLVECHGGRVSIASGDGRTGTTVTVVLPFLERLQVVPHWQQSLNDPLSSA
ncbi:ATP-binding region ATPase domain protein, partial [Burkholderia sp. BT03]